MGVDEERVRGVRKAVKDFQKTKKIQIYINSIGISYPERERVYNKMFKKFDFSKRTAVFCLADRFALEVGSYLQERGISIPEDIGLAGFDGISNVAKNFYPRLTTVRQNLFQKAVLAVNELISAVENQDYKMQNHVVDVNLVIRRST